MSVHLKANSEILCRNDFLNLIIGLINRQQRPFKKDDILDLVSYYSYGMEYQLGPEDDVAEIIKDHLVYGCRASHLVCKSGIYYPRDLRYFISHPLNECPIIELQ